VDEPWVAPYLVQLLGEYVVEITRAIVESQGVAKRHFAAFAGENPAFVALTRTRVISYWNAYQRRHGERCRRLAEWPELRFVDGLTA
jgi:hypothetical protein